MQKKTVILILVILVSIFVAWMFLRNYLPNALMVPDKSQRVNDILSDTSENRINVTSLEAEIEATLSKYVNWDNLFLSDGFKSKYSSRKDIIDDANQIYKIRCMADYEYGEDVVMVYAYHRKSLFDFDDEDDTATRYYFQYKISDAGEIDDLIRLDKCDVAVITGEPVETVE